jgi:hypothetical protein
LAGDRRVIDRFADQLPDPVRERVIGVEDANLLWEEPAAVADRLGNALDQAWRRGAQALVERAIQAASQGGAGALGWVEVLESLVQHRVEHLVFAVSAPPDTDSLPPLISQALDDPSAGMLIERAIEHAVASGADVTAVSHDIEELVQVGGVVATLRY